MKLKTTLLPLVLCLGAQCVTLFGEVPKPQPLTRYTTLWKASRICSKPIVEVAPDNGPVFEDYVLLSVTPVGDQYMVSIRSKKDTTGGRIRIFPGESNAEGYRVMGVEQSANYMDTKVKISMGGKTGIVQYDEKFMGLKKPALAAVRGKGKGATPARATPKPGGGRPTTTKTKANQLPPGLQAAGLTGAAAKPAATNPAAGGTRKPRVRRVPTP